jgi:hypothetical protein
MMEFIAGRHMSIEYGVSMLEELQGGRIEELASLC